MDRGGGVLQSMGSQKLDMTERVSTAHNPRFLKPKLDLGFPGNSAGKESTCNAGDPGSIPRWGRSPGEGIGYPLHGLPYWLRW